jgi:hypothetical protein
VFVVLIMSNSQIEFLVLCNHGRPVSVVSD